MVTRENEYFANLDVLQNVNSPAFALLADAEIVHDIDLKTRTITPISVTILEKDHKSEVLYFSVDRYMDYMDLAKTCCIIQYNIDNTTRFYPVPFYDVYSKAPAGKIVFPWCLDYNITKKSKIIEFSIRFFQIGTQLDENNIAQYVLTYNLNTLPASLGIKKGMTEYHLEKNDEIYLQPGDKEIIMNYVDNRMSTLSRKIYWSVLDDSYSDDHINTTEIQSILTNIVSK